MSFLIKYNALEGISVKAVEITNGQKAFDLKTSDGSIILFGDLISEPFKGKPSDFLSWLQSAKGNFNGLYSSGRTYFIFSAMFNALPLFYLQDEKGVYVSDQIKNLIPFLKENRVDDFHFLERILFNYSLTDRTCVEGIRQVPVNSFLKLEGTEYKFIKHTEISDLFQESPLPSKKCLSGLVDLFNSQLSQYLPNQIFNAAFTAGFDGRSIIASCIKNKKDFIAYSFGTKESDDVNIPYDISKKIGINYQPILIDNKYLSDIYPDSTKKIVSESNGLSTIGRAHYHYGSEILSRRSGIMVSGNCGSELLRASNTEGVLTTSVFFHWLKNGLPVTLDEFMKLFPEYSFLTKERFSEVYQKLVSELEVKRRKNPHQPINARLYYLMWEESLRNYFGGELSMQQNHLIHRSPFMDYTFFKEIQKTMLSGAYYKYRDTNPVRRMKGQLFYANFIRKNNENLFKLPTGKGYSPSDILSFKGKIKLICSKLIRKNSSSERNEDPLFSTRGFKTYYDESVNNLSRKLEGYVDKRQNMDENSMKTLFSFSIFFDYLDAERSILDKNRKN